MTAAAGAGAYFLFSKRCAPTRQRLAEGIRRNTKIAVDEVSGIVGRTRKNVKTALQDVAEITETAAGNL